MPPVLVFAPTRPVRRKLIHLFGLVFLLPILGLRDDYLPIALIMVVVTTRWLVHITAYGLIGVLLLLPFVDRFAIAGAWTVLILGDGVAGLTGIWFGQHHLPWNSRKTVIGTGAFAIAAFAGLVVLVGLLALNLDATAIAKIAVIAIIASLVESLPVPVNDNFTVVVAAGAAVHWLIASPS